MFQLLLRATNHHRCSIDRSLLQTLVQKQSKFHKMSGANETTAGVVIIGDEIIRGHVHDCNSYYLCQKLHHLGVNVRAIVTVPDDVTSISNYVRQFSSSYTHVITAGGIGPTHDDITYEAIAKAFDDETEVNGDLEILYKTYFKEKYTDAHKKLASIPKSATLVENDRGFPIVNIRNVFILPGVPKFLKLAFRMLEQRLHNPHLSFYKEELFLRVDEMKIVAPLTVISEEYKGTVAIGSYPEWHNNYYKVKIVLESQNELSLQSCKSRLERSLPADSVVAYDVDSLCCADDKLVKLIGSTSPLATQLEKTMSVILEALERFLPHEICIGFNGGKDCTALLHLWFAMLLKKYGRGKSEQMITMYIRCRTPFPEVESFIEESISRYNLNMLRFDGTIKEQLQEMRKNHPQIKAVVMGTRCHDPHGANLQAFQMTDDDWPKFMRINPILQWSYNDVWYYLRNLGLPYCSLYDVGYTSLGSMENTHPNPALRYTDSNNVVHYYPAHTLIPTDPDLERAGRSKR